MEVLGLFRPCFLSVRRTQLRYFVLGLLERFGQDVLGCVVLLEGPVVGDLLAWKKQDFDELHASVIVLILSRWVELRKHPHF